MEMAVRVRGGGQDEDGREQAFWWSALLVVLLMASSLIGCGPSEDEAAPVEVDPPFALPELQAEVPLYELVIPPETLARFEADPFLEEQPATFVFDGQPQPVKVRLRGSSSRYFPKKSWRIEFPKDVEFDGRRKHNLVAEFQDRTMMTEKLAYDLMLGMGVPAPRTKFVRLVINGAYQGVYLDIERVDKSFTEAHGFADADPTIYRCGAKDGEMKLWRTDYQQGWQKETNESEGEGEEDIQGLMHIINRTPEPELPRVLAGHFELETYLRSLAAEVLMSNNIPEDSQSYLILDRSTGRWTYVPWDLNNNDARWWPTYGLTMKPVVEHPLIPFSLQDAWVEQTYHRRKQRADFLPTFSNLNTRIAFHPELRERLFTRIERSLAEVFNAEVLFPRLEAMHALIAPYMEGDPYVNLGPEGQPDGDGLAKFHAGLPFLKKYVEGRTAFVRAELERLRAPRTTLRLSAVHPGEGWVELHNPGDVEVSTAGLVLSADLRRTVSTLRRPETSGVLPTVQVPPHGSIRITREGLGFALPAEGELGLVDGKSVVGALDVLFYGALAPGQYYARGEGERWELR
jgi:spore coat protein H